MHSSGGACRGGEGDAGCREIELGRYGGWFICGRSRDAMEGAASGDRAVRVCVGEQRQRKLECSET